MVLAPTFRRNPLKSMLDFAADREREANSIGDVITQITQPILGGMGVQTGAGVPQPAVMRGPVPQAQALGAMTGPRMAPTPVDFTARSTELLSAADPRLREVLTETERRAREQGIEIQVSETLRDPERQAELVAQGKSQTMNSRHLTGNAADIFIQNPDGTANWDFEAYRPVADIAKQVAAEKGYDDLVWGGDWKTLKDGVHFQLGGAAVTGGSGAPTMMGGAGDDMLGGGNVEDILARLYPEPSEQDARATRRRDILAGVSQVFGALDRGGMPDVSNIRAQQEERKRQAVLDMRERERARSAASLVYSQTNDSALASAIASGSISYGDVVNERERRRVEQAADSQRVKEEQRAGRLASLVETAWPTLGLPEDMKTQVLESIAAGDDPDTVFTLQEQAKVAEAARAAQEAQETAEATRAAAVEAFSTSADPVEAMAGRFMALDPAMSMDDALTRASERLKTTTQEGFTLSPGQVRFGPNGEQVAAVAAEAGAQGEVADIAKAKLLFDGGAVNPQTGQPFTSPAEALAAIQFYKAPTTAAAGGVSLQYSPEGGFSLTTGAPVAGTPAAGGSVVDVANAAPGTATVVQDGQLVSVPVAGSPAYNAAMLDIAAKEQELAQAIATAPTTAARAQAEAELAQVQAQKAALTMPTEVAAGEVDLATKRQELDAAIAAAPTALRKAELEAEKLTLEVQEAQARQDVDAATREATLAGLQADAEKKKAEVEALRRDEAAQSSAEYENAMRQFGTLETASKAVLENVFSPWSTGVVGGIATTMGRPLNIPTQRSSLLSAAKQLGSQAMLKALVDAKAAGVTMTPVSNLDVSALGASESALLEPENLQADALASAVVTQYNYAKDQLFGPKDLTRLDEYGNEYTVGANTLGTSEDTFARHWTQIPPEVAEAWRNGDISAFPTTDAAYAEAANVLNAMTTNWELYQGDLDRAMVGEAEQPSEPTDATDLPPPPSGIPEDEWAETWQFMSKAARDAYIKQTQGTK